MTYAPDMHAPLTPWNEKKRINFLRRQGISYSSKEVADGLGIDIATVRRHAHSKQLGFRRPGGWRYSEREVDLIRRSIGKPNTHRIAA